MYGIWIARDGPFGALIHFFFFPRCVCVYLTSQQKEEYREDARTLLFLIMGNCGW